MIQQQLVDLITTRCLQAVSSGFNADYGLFTATTHGLAYPQPAATTIPNGLGLLEFLGLVVGKALYEGILLDVPLAPFFVARLQGRRPMFDDLAALDAELYRSLVQLKRYKYLRVSFPSLAQEV